jgi:hypothetical protein
VDHATDLDRPSLKVGRYWLAALLAVGALLRIALLAGYDPIAQPDTGTYMVGGARSGGW